jgi:hypothetical protein
LAASEPELPLPPSSILAKLPFPFLDLSETTVITLLRSWLWQNLAHTGYAQERVFGYLAANASRCAVLCYATLCQQYNNTSNRPMLHREAVSR